jgi:predicted DNA-binding transcriptional regulator AlpA
MSKTKRAELADAQPSTREIMDTTAVSEMTGIPAPTLRGWRHQSTVTGNGVGPKSFKMGGVVRYRRSDVQKWLDDQYAATVRGDGVVVR